MKKVKIAHEEIIPSFAILIYIGIVFLFPSVYRLGFILLILLPVFVKKNKIILALLGISISIYLPAYGKLMYKCSKISAAEKGISETAIEFCKTFHLYIPRTSPYSGFFMTMIYSYLILSILMALSILVLYETDPRKKK